MKFNELGLSDELIRAIEKLNYTEVLPVQEKVIPYLLKNKDILVQSKTGSGKTASYAIPEIEKIDWLKNHPQVLVITPTRELAKQVAKDFETLGAYKRINTVCLLGQQPIKRQMSELKQKVHVVCGTIGRILDHIERGTLLLDEIHTCIIDEADECLNLGFKEDLERILSYLPTCTMAMFSATIPNEIKETASQYLYEPKMIKIEQTSGYNSNVKAYLTEVTKENRIDVLFNIINQQLPQQAIVFANFRESVETVFDEFYDRGLSCCMIHGGLEQDERLENMRDFKKGMFRFLIASDVAARGIDISQITHVYNYECPTTGEDFIHRIGRSGRVNNEGCAVTLMLPTQYKYIERIQEETGVSFEVLEVDETPQELDPILKTSNKVTLKEEVIENEKMKLYIKAGKSKKLRAKDIVGAIMQIPNIAFEDIGVIEVLDNVSYVDILNNKGNYVLQELKKRPIKNKNIPIEKAR